MRYLRSVFNRAALLGAKAKLFVPRNPSSLGIEAFGVSAYILDAWSPLPIGETIAASCFLYVASKNRPLDNLHDRFAGSPLSPQDAGKMLVLAGAYISHAEEGGQREEIAALEQSLQRIVNSGLSPFVRAVAQESLAMRDQWQQIFEEDSDTILRSYQDLEQKMIEVVGNKEFGKLQTSAQHITNEVSIAYREIATSAVQACKERVSTTCLTRNFVMHSVLQNLSCVPIKFFQPDKILSHILSGVKDTRVVEPERHAMRQLLEPCCC